MGSRFIAGSWPRCHLPHESSAQLVVRAAWDDTANLLRRDALSIFQTIAHTRRTSRDELTIAPSPSRATGTASWKLGGALEPTTTRIVRANYRDVALRINVWAAVPSRRLVGLAESGVAVHGKRYSHAHRRRLDHEGLKAAHGVGCQRLSEMGVVTVRENQHYLW